MRSPVLDFGSPRAGHGWRVTITSSRSGVTSNKKAPASRHHGAGAFGLVRDSKADSELVCQTMLMLSSPRMRFRIWPTCPRSPPSNSPATPQSKFPRRLPAPGSAVI